MSLEIEAQPESTATHTPAAAMLRALSGEPLERSASSRCGLPTRSILRACLGQGTSIECSPPLRCALAIYGGCSGGVVSLRSQRGQDAPISVLVGSKRVGALIRPNRREAALLRDTGSPRSARSWSGRVDSETRLLSLPERAALRASRAQPSFHHLSVVLPRRAIADECTGREEGVCHHMGLAARPSENATASLVANRPSTHGRPASRTRQPEMLPSSRPDRRCAPSRSPDRPGAPYCQPSPAWSPRPDRSRQRVSFT